MTHTRTTLMAAIASVALAAAACGTAGAGEPASPTATTPTTTMAMDHDMGDMSVGGMNMGDAHATPAYDVAGAAVVAGDFAPLPSAGADAIEGRAWLARSSAGTTVTIDLTGLDPNTAHIAHVHAASCENNGGPHYMHDPSGLAHPPNEIHLALTSDHAGGGFMTAENPTVASDEAVSVVIHEAGDNAPKLACADLVPNG